MIFLQAETRPNLKNVLSILTKLCQEEFEWREEPVTESDNIVAKYIMKKLAAITEDLTIAEIDALFETGTNLISKEFPFENPQIKLFDMFQTLNRSPHLALRNSMMKSTCRRMKMRLI